MTERIKGFIVVLDNDIREDDAIHIVDAIKMIKHVQTVVPNIGNVNDIINRERVKLDFRIKLYDFINKEFP